MQHYYLLTMLKLKFNRVTMSRTGWDYQAWWAVYAYRCRLVSSKNGRFAVDDVTFPFPFPFPRKIISKLEFKLNLNLWFWVRVSSILVRQKPGLKSSNLWFKSESAPLELCDVLIIYWLLADYLTYPHHWPNMRNRTVTFIINPHFIWSLFVSHDSCAAVAVWLNDQWWWWSLIWVDCHRAVQRDRQTDRERDGHFSSRSLRQPKWVGCFDLQWQTGLRTFLPNVQRVQCKTGLITN